MSSDRKTAVAAIFLAVSCLHSCIPAVYSGMSAAGPAPALSVAGDTPDETVRSRSGDRPVVDSLRVSSGPVIMNAVRDSGTGEMTAVDVIEASRIVARFRNVAERMGRVSFAFDITVPEELISSRYQLRFFPVVEAGDSIMHLEPVLITGSGYRKRQLRGYERYRNFISSIVTDSTDFIRIRQLETFLERHFPEIHAMKGDSTLIPEPLAGNIFGVSQYAALKHYTDNARKRRNAWKVEHRDEVFRKLVKSPMERNAVLDTVMSSGEGGLVYRYSHEMASAPGLRKLYVSLEGAVYLDGDFMAAVPDAGKLTFYVSSMSTLADYAPRYVFRVLDRVVTDSTEAFLDFCQGSAAIDTLSERNSSELSRIRSCFRDVLSRRDLVLDSVVVTASCSPEGSWEYNSRLARDRSEAVRECVADMGNASVASMVVTRSVPENWDRLARLAANDTSLGSACRNTVLAVAGMRDKDEAERILSGLPEYRHLLEKLYPELRTVNFRFHMHRAGVKKDTVHTRQLDTVYMKGLQAMKELDYRKAAGLLLPYRDYNAALALASSGYDGHALDILSGLGKHDARAEYLEALLLSRAGERQKAVECFMKCLGMDPSMRHRANLDPEMSEVVKACGNMF